MSGAVLGPLAVTAGREQPACVAHEFLHGAPAGIGEVTIRIAHHPLGAVIVVLDGDVGRHRRFLPHDLSVSRHPGRVNGLKVPFRRATSLRERVGEQPGQEADQRHIGAPDPAGI